MDKEILEVMHDAVRLLAILAKRNTTQTRMIEEMGDVGFFPKRIAELLKTSPNTVSVALHHMKNKKSKNK